MIPPQKDIKVLEIDSHTSSVFKAKGATTHVLNDGEKKMHSILFSTNFFQENVIVVVTYGPSRSKNITEWKRKSFVVDYEAKTYRVWLQPICELTDSEIMGYVIVNENGEIKESEYVYIIRSIPVTREIEINQKFL